MATGVDQSIPESLDSRPQKLKFIVDPKLWAAYISVRMHGHCKETGKTGTQSLCAGETV